jgi:exonuclease V
MYGTDQESNYGSDFNTDEEELLDDLFKTVTEHATVQPATPIPTLNSPSTAPERTSTRSNTPDQDLAPLYPAAIAALVADIEDGVTQPGTAPGARLPKVLGREGPRSPWRSSQGQPGRASELGRMASASASPRASNSNRPSPFGMLSLRVTYDSN